MSAPVRSDSGSPTPCFSTSSSGSSSSTPAFRATFSSRSSAGPIVGGFPCVITAARRTALPDRSGDPGVDVVEKVRPLTVDEMEEHFPVAFWPRQARVYDPHRLRLPLQGCVGELAHDAPPDFDITHHAALHLTASRLELRLHEHDGLPTRPRRRQREPETDEGDVRDDELRGERQLAQLPRVDALEHDDTLVAAHLLVQLAVADVERDHARCAALEEDVGEAACGRTDVEAVTP